MFPHLPTATVFEVTDLQMDTVYSFSIMAFNKLGESDYTNQLVQAKTASKYLVLDEEHDFNQS